MVSPNGSLIKVVQKFITELEKKNIENFIENSIFETIDAWILSENIVIEKIGIAAPGIVQGTTILNSYNLGIYNYNLCERIQSKYPQAKITLHNDAKCAGLAEKCFGSLRNYNDAVFICIGTGIGGACFINGKLLEPAVSPGFEFGHIIIDKNGKKCTCGSEGCFEQYCSMKKFKSEIKSILNLPDFIDGDTLHTELKNNIDLANIQCAISNYLDNLCIGISNIINIFEPQAIAIGGGFSEYSDIFLDRFIATLYNSNYIFYKGYLPKILIAELGNNAGIIGSTIFN